MARLIIVASIALAGMGAACGDKAAAPPPANCPDLPLPASCPVPPTTFSADANPIIQHHCLTCHSPGGREPTHPFDSYDNIRAQISTITMQIRQCRMPPADAGAPPLTEDQRRTLLVWAISCNAPNN